MPGKLRSYRPQRVLLRVTAAAVLGGYVTATIGIPLPAAPREFAERFPCEACPCGCATAQHCWTSCCCHTLAERITWARREGVRPPEAALAQAERAGIDVSHWRPAVYAVARDFDSAAVESASPCCRNRTACCAARAACCAPCEPTVKSPAPPGVSIVKALACQGIVDAWLSLGVAVMPAFADIVDTKVVEYVAPGPPIISLGVAEAPTPPPPRLGTALS